jgi:ABC-type multidrug transport system fused ATPase/permease subunit
VLQAGSIAEQGTHQELLAKQGAYFHLLNLGQPPAQLPQQQPAEE